MLKSTSLPNDIAAIKAQIFDLLVALADQERSARDAGQDVLADVCFDAKLRLTDALSPIATHSDIVERFNQRSPATDAANFALSLLQAITDEH